MINDLQRREASDGASSASPFAGDAQTRPDSQDSEKSVSSSPEIREDTQDPINHTHQASDAAGDVPTGLCTARGRAYKLSLVSIPVHCTTSGSGLCEPPLIAKLMISDGGVSSNTATSQTMEIFGEDDLPYLIASVTLRDTQSRHGTSTDSVRSTMIRGDLSASAEVYLDELDTEQMYFIFPSLQITRRGCYKLGVSLTGIWPDELSPVLAAGAVFLMAVESETATLALSEESLLEFDSAQVDVGTAGLLQCLRGQGARIDGSERNSSESTSV